MKRTRLAILGTAILLLLMVYPSSKSLAGDYTVRQCHGAGQLDYFGNYLAVNGMQGRLHLVSGCTQGGSGKIGAYQDLGGSNFTPGGGAQFYWTTPSSVSVIATEMTARLKDANSIRAELIAYNGSTVIDLDQSFPHDGETRTSRWANASKPQTLVAARLVCNVLQNCANQPSSPKAFMELTDAEFTARDSGLPSVSPSGGLWDWAADGAFHRGTGTIQLDATDQGSGISAAWVEVNGLRVDLAEPDCPAVRGSYATRFTPCPLSLTRSHTFDTSEAPFQEGSNLVRVCVADYAASLEGANRTCSQNRTLLVDNQSPLPPVNFGSTKGSNWQPENGFGFGWTIPSGQVAPVIGAVYSIYRADDSSFVKAGYFPGTGVTAGGPLEVPEVGAYRVILFLLDEAGNIGETAETTIRFDDRPPGNVDPEPAAGWISRDELPLEQEIEKAEAGGPSGISGYAMEVSSDGPASPCATVVCLAPEITLTGGPDLRTGTVGNLSEGSHWISAAAVSGASKSSLEPGAIQVEVDRTFPTATISGVPATWVNHPVTVTVQSFDALSGMTADPLDDGSPATFIDADTYATYEAPGSAAAFTVATEGANRIRYWAEDLAGNTNDGRQGPDGIDHPDPGQAVVRIDTEPPEAVFQSGRDPEEPERVNLTATDADSGVAAAQIAIRKAGSGEQFSDLATSGEAGEFTAWIPSDDLASGAYELRATVKDRAGNEAFADRAEAGQPMVLNLPLKQAVSVSATLEKERTAMRTAYSVRPFVEGRLVAGGQPLINQALSVTESLAVGSSQSERTTIVRTDGNGRYRVRLIAGPSRKIQVEFAGTRKYSRTASPELSLSVKGMIRFKIRKKKLFNGAVARMSGRVGFAGALRPARGKLVAIQFFDPSRRKWRPVEVLRTGPGGSFRFRYRFRTITTAQRILFRAVALQEAGWPYLPSTSKPRSVIVYPRG